MWAKLGIRPEGYAEWALLTALLGIGALFFLTQEINPFPHDHWFATHEMLVSPPESPRYNYTPIAAPAFLYGFNHVIVRLAGLGLEQEMVLGVLTHHLLLALAAWVVFLTSKALDLGFTVGACSALGLALYLQSTQMAQSFWSESVMLPLICLAVYGALRVSARPPTSTRISAAWGAGLGVVLALAVITRAVPILIAPAILLFIRPDLTRALWQRFSVGFLVAMATVILCQMGLNALRFDRFELSHSTGLHLWNAVSLDGDVMLADSELYQSLKQKTPNIQQTWWWELPREKGQDDVVFEDLIRPMVLAGIAKHPLVFLRRGFEELWVMLPDAPAQIGYERAIYYNPLRRDTLLPAPWFKSDLVARLLKRGNRFSLRLYSWIAPLVLGGGFLLAAVRTRQSEGGLADPTVRTWLFLAYVFVSAIFVSNLIERSDVRYALPYLGVLAVLAGVTGRLALQAVRRLGQADREPLG